MDLSIVPAPPLSFVMPVGTSIKSNVGVTNNTMFNIRISEEQRQYAWKLINDQKSFPKSHIQRTNDKEKIYYGFLAQTAMADAIGHARPEANSGFDGGQDFNIRGLKVDLKTVVRRYMVQDTWVNNLVAEQTKYDTDIYLFASLNKDMKPQILTICGFLPKKLIVGNTQFFHPKGSRRVNNAKVIIFSTDTYEIPNRNLITAPSAPELVESMQAFV